MLRLRVPVIVEVGRKRLPLSEVLGWVPGSIIELPMSSDEPLGLHVNNKRIGTGEAVKVAENFGLRIDALASKADRVEAMTAGD